jgi:bacterioferritin (cytochrome b1)
VADGALKRLTPGEVLKALHVALAAERRAAADYDAHGRAAERSGAPRKVCEALETLRDVEKEHAARLAARIAALGDMPTEAPSHPEPPATGDNLTGWVEADLGAEQWAIVEYARLVAHVLDDDETVELMTELLCDEIRHANWLRVTLRSLST